MLLWRTRRKRSVIDPGRSCALAVHDGSKVAKWNIALPRGNMYGSQGGDVCKEGGFWVEHYVLCECEFWAIQIFGQPKLRWFLRCFRRQFLVEAGGRCLFRQENIVSVLRKGRIKRCTRIFRKYP